MSAHLEELGTTLVQQILGVGRTMQMYDPGNHAVTVALHNLAMNLNTLHNLGQGRATIQFIDQILVLNDVRVNAKSTAVQSFQMLKAIFVERGIGGMAISRPVDPETLRRFFVVFVQPVPDEGARQRIRGGLDQFMQAGIELLQSRTLGGDDDVQTVNVSSMGFALQTYTRVVMAFRELIRALQEDRDPMKSPLSFVRVTQDLVEVALERPSNLVRALWLLSMNREAVARDPAAFHAANMAVLSVMVARALGLGRLAMLDCGTASLLATAPEQLFPGVVGADPRSRSPAQIGLLLGRSMPALTKHMQLNPDTIKRVLVSTEYLFPYVDPDSGERTDVHPYARIAAATHAFDLFMTQHGAPPPQALAWMQPSAGSLFDPIMVDALEAVVQCYMNS